MPALQPPCLLPASTPALAYLTTALGVWSKAMVVLAGLRRREQGDDGGGDGGGEGGPSRASPSSPTDPQAVLLRQLDAMLRSPHTHVALQPELAMQVGGGLRPPLQRCGVVLWQRQRCAGAGRTAAAGRWCTVTMG